MDYGEDWPVAGKEIGVPLVNDTRDHTSGMLLGQIGLAARSKNRDQGRPIVMQLADIRQSDLRIHGSGPGQIWT